MHMTTRSLSLLQHVECGWSCVPNALSNHGGGGGLDTDRHSTICRVGHSVVCCSWTVYQPICYAHPCPLVEFRVPLWLIMYTCDSACPTLTTAPNSQGKSS